MDPTTQKTTVRPAAPYSVKWWARKYGVSPGLLRKHISERRLACIRLGGRVLISESQMRDYLTRNSTAAVAEQQPAGVL